jgi:hypothetical protein
LGGLALCPKFEQTQNEEATSSGTLIHDACASGIVAGLSETDQTIVANARALAEQEKAGLPAPVIDLVEHRLRYPPLDLEGTADRILIGSNGVMLVIDWKTGFGGLPDDADDSLQLYSYIMGGLAEFPNVHTARGFLTNPRTGTWSEELVVPRDRMPEIENRLRVVIDRAQHPFSTPCPGSHCAKCQHALCCPGLVPTIQTAVAPLIPSSVMELFRDPQSVSLTPPQRAARAVIRMVLERWCEAEKDDNNAYLRAGNDPPIGFKRMVRSTGLRIPEGERLAALTALRAAGIDESVIAAGCSIGLGKIIEAQTLVTGDKKAAAQQVQGAVLGIAVEGTTEYMTRDKKGVDDISLLFELRKSLTGG